MVRMVDVSRKKVIRREATAEGCLSLKKSTMKAIVEGKIRKGDVISSSKLAGIQGAKATSSTLPLCHQIPLDSVSLEFETTHDKVIARCTVCADYKTGVEMEALVGVTVALLNVWDMVKYLEKDKAGQYPGTHISGVRVLSKVKGGPGHGRGRA